MSSLKLHSFKHSFYASPTSCCLFIIDKLSSKQDYFRTASFIFLCLCVFVFLELRHLFSNGKNCYLLSKLFKHAGNLVIVLILGYNYIISLIRLFSCWLVFLFIPNPLFHSPSNIPWFDRYAWGCVLLYCVVLSMFYICKYHCITDLLYMCVYIYIYQLYLILFP